jgi:hypothetical protein
VIPDPTPWRVELVKLAARLEAKTKQSRWTDRTDVLLERDFVVGAYVMRKLLRCYPAVEAAKKSRIPVRRFEPNARLPIAPGDAGVSYDLELSRRDRLSVAELCHQILHNDIFAFYCGETADLFDGIYVSSDPEDENVILVIASDFIALCKDLGMEKL